MARQAHAQRLAGLGAVVAGVAHEINNPIQYVLGNLEELEATVAELRGALHRYREILYRETGAKAAGLIADAELKLDLNGGRADLDDMIADAQMGARSVRDLVRDLLATARGSDRPVRESAPVDVHAILDFTLRITRQEAQPHADILRSYGAHRRIETDRTRVGQIFLNLVRNAIAACRDAGPERQRIVVRSQDTAHGIRVEIQDSGGGIPPEIENRLFTAFCTSRPPGEGSGLGLFLSRELAHELGGRLDFRSAECQGTVFGVELPARLPEEAQPDPQAAESSPTANTPPPEDQDG